jgi:hypothetical protein
MNFEYFIVPSAVMAANVKSFHQKWLVSPRKNGRAHKDIGIRAVSVVERGPSYSWSVCEYKNR